MAPERPRERLCSDPIHNVGYLLPRTPLIGISVHNVAMGPVEILLGLVVLGLVAYVLWRLVVRPRR
jgi:hypothetical protein